MAGWGRWQNGRTFQRSPSQGAGESAILPSTIEDDPPHLSPPVELHLVSFRWKPCSPVFNPRSSPYTVECEAGTPSRWFQGPHSRCFSPPPRAVGAKSREDTRYACAWDDSHSIQAPYESIAPRKHPEYPATKVHQRRRGRCFYYAREGLRCGTAL
jgi:hypothetical protein